MRCLPIGTLDVIESPQRRMILLIDQTEDTRDLYGNWFFSRGFDVVATALDNIALAIVETYRPDLVLANLGANPVDSIRVIRRIRSAAKTCHIPVIVLTALTDPRALNAISDAGVEVFRTLADFEGLERYVAALPLEARPEDLECRTRCVNLSGISDRSKAWSRRES